MSNYVINLGHFWLEVIKMESAGLMRLLRRQAGRLVHQKMQILRQRELNDGRSTSLYKKVYYQTMTDYEKELVKKYPEAVAFVGVATSIWNGSNAPTNWGSENCFSRKNAEE